MDLNPNILKWQKQKQKNRKSEKGFISRERSSLVYFIQNNNNNNNNNKTASKP